MTGNNIWNTVPICLTICIHICIHTHKNVDMLHSICDRRLHPYFVFINQKRSCHFRPQWVKAYPISKLIPTYMAQAAFHIPLSHTVVVCNYLHVSGMPYAWVPRLCHVMPASSSVVTSGSIFHSIFTCNWHDDGWAVMGGWVLKCRNIPTGLVGCNNSL